MYFEKGSQNDDFLFNGIKFPKSCMEGIIDAMTDNDLKFEPHVRICVKKQTNAKNK